MDYGSTRKDESSLEGFGSLESSSLINDTSAQDFTLKQKIYLTFDDPNFSKTARILNIYIAILILFSTICLCLQSIYSLTDSDSEKLFWICVEVFIALNFSIDYLVRLFTCPKVLPFVLNPLNIIDLISILPFYISAIFSTVDIEGLGAIRVLRLIRIFRIFKIGRTSEALQLVAVSFKRSGQGIFVLFFMLTLAVVFYSSFLHYAELTICELNTETGEWIYTSGPNEGRATPFQNILVTFWWATVTMTTVGYGDATPVSPAGKFVASLAMVSGILVLAFPINMIGVHFSETYADFKEKRERREKAQRQSQFYQDMRTKDDKMDEIRNRMNQLQKRIDEFNKELATISRLLADENLESKPVFFDEQKQSE